MYLLNTVPSFIYIQLPRTSWYKMFFSLVLTSCLVVVQLQSDQDNEIIKLQFNSTLVTFQQSDYDTFRSDGFKVRSMVTCCTRCYQVSKSYHAHLLFYGAYYEVRRIKFIYKKINKNTKERNQKNKRKLCTANNYIQLSEAMNKSIQAVQLIYCEAADTVSRSL